MKRLGTENFYIDLSLNGNSSTIVGGEMGDFEVLTSPLFEAELKSISGEKLRIGSQSVWSKIFTREHIGYTEIIFAGHEKANELCIILKARVEVNAIVWSISVLNDSPTWSVMNINYPSPLLKHPEFDLFVPYFGGRTVSNAGNIANESTSFTLNFNAEEYNIANKHLPEDFSIEGKHCTVSGKLNKDEIRVWKIK